ncbi:MAG: PfkB family carbohydrate kinase [Collinsella sp.]
MRAHTARETVGGSGFITNAGGKGANQAVAAARVALARMIGAVGRDALARCRSGAQDAGVDCDFVVHRDDVETGTATIIRCEETTASCCRWRQPCACGRGRCRALRRLVADELDSDASEIARLRKRLYRPGRMHLVATAERLFALTSWGSIRSLIQRLPELPAGLACGRPGLSQRDRVPGSTGILPTDDVSCIAALKALLDKGAELRSSRWAAPVGYARR